MIALALVATLLAGGAPQEPPQLIYTNPHHGAAYWVEAGSALGPDGHPKPDAFTASGVRTIEGLLAATPDARGCVPFGPVFVSLVNGPDRSSVAGVLRWVSVALVGRVLGRAYGFHDGMPGQLLTVQVEQDFKRKLAAGAIVYSDLPLGDFDLGGKHLCVRDRRFAAAPDIGERVVIFGHPISTLRDVPLIHPLDQEGLVTISPSGELRLPLRWQGSDLRSQEDLLAAIRAALGE